MRPGQAAPEFAIFRSSLPSQRKRFNEAGAGCPGIQSTLTGRRLPRERFNEAGAGCPGIQPVSTAN